MIKREAKGEKVRGREKRRDGDKGKQKRKWRNKEGGRERGK